MVNQREAPVDLISGSLWARNRIAQKVLCGPIGTLPQHGGAGVDLYVIDSGVTDPQRTLFDDRLRQGYPRDSRDVEDHGTEVAGLAAGNDFGLADEASVIPVRVVGDDTDLISGVRWVTATAPRTGRPSVALIPRNAVVMDPDLDDAVARSIAAGVTYVIAAGNDDQDAGNVSPARVEAAITVGAITRTNDCDCDVRWIGNVREASNYGAVVDLFAPGDANLTRDSSGQISWVNATSAAAAIVAGVAARYLARSHPGPYPPPQDVEGGLRKLSSRSCISIKGVETPIRVVYALFDQRLTTRVLDGLRAAWRSVVGGG